MKVKRVEQQIITRENTNFKAIDDICFKSKNLYNYTNYILRQSFIHTGKLPHENELTRKLRARNNIDYYELFGNVNQACVKQLYVNWKSFFAASKDYSSHPEKYKSKPKIPKYKEKTKGRNLAIISIGGVNEKDGYLYFNKKANLIPIKTKVKQEQLKQVRFIPRSNCYVMEVVYEIEIDANLKLNSENYLSIDLGINNFATCYDSHTNKAFIINGKPLKSMNQYYNKKKAELQSILIKSNNSYSSHRIDRLNLKRKNKISDFMHKTSRYVIDYCFENDIGNIVIGHNKDQKQDINLKSQTNQNFTFIPFLIFIQQLQYKGQEKGISIIITEESYTSKIDHSIQEKMCHHDNYAGKRIKRGLFKRSDGKVLNCDLNGAIGILRKVIDESQFKEIVDRGFMVNPIKITIF